MDARTGLDAGDREISIYSEDLELLSLFEGQDHRCLRFYHPNQMRERLTSILLCSHGGLKRQFLINFERQFLLPSIIF